MRRLGRVCLAFWILPGFLFFSPATAPVEHKTLAIGSTAPDFSLKSVDGKIYNLASFRNANILVIVFTCNHCPTAQAYEDRIIRLSKDYASRSVQVVAIMPNDPKAINLDELGYTDLSDTYAEMKIRANEKHFNFPYLYDGGTQIVARAYGPIATPHVFIFDKTRRLRYSGRVDDVEKPGRTPHVNDARNAIESLLQDKPVTVQTTKVFGCSIKWTEKSNWIKQAKEEWAKEPVLLDTIGVAGIQALVKNHSDKLRLINVWATWCGPCVTEYPSFIEMNRMYRKREFEFISISADDPSKKSKVLRFLEKAESSATNYLFNTEDKYKLIEAIDTAWQGALPYTLLVEPGGKIVYARQGPVDPQVIKRKIVDDPFVGRYY